MRVSPQHTQQLAPTALAAGVDLLVIQGTIVSAEHVTTQGDALNLKEFIADLDVPVIVGGAANYQTALHLMRTGAAGVIVGVGADSFSTTDTVMGIRVPLASAIADAAAARRDYLDETGGRYVHVIANGRIETSGAIARALACGADAVQLGEPLRIAAEAPAGGVWWDSVAAHPRLPRGGASAAVAPAGTLEQVLLGPARDPDGRTNLFGALRRTMAKTGYRDLKEFQRVDLVIGGQSRLMDFPTVLVVDFGAQYAQLIARRIREAGVYSEIVPSTSPVEEIAGPQAGRDRALRRPVSVYAPGAPQVDPALFEAGVPAFGICYGFQAMAASLGGTVARTGDREYGGTPLTVTTAGRLFGDLPVRAVGVDEPRGRRRRGAARVHRDRHLDRRAGRRVRGRRPPAGRGAVPPRGAAHRARPDRARALPVRHRRPRADLDDGQRRRGAGGARSARRSATGRALCALSGGVDSAVAAALVQRAIGDRLTCVYVDHGLMREGETEQIERDFVAVTGVDLRVVDAREQFLAALAGVSDPEEKRKIIGREFIRVFEQAALDVVGDAKAHGETVDFLVQGTLYPDVVESGGGTGTANIKSHHNVGGLPEDLHVRAGRAAAHAVQGRGARGRRRSSGCPSRWSGASRSPGPAWASASSARSPRSGSTSCAGPTRSPAPSSPPPAWTARSGSARWCCWPTSARSACRATAAPTGTRSCCGRCPARTR